MKILSKAKRPKVLSGDNNNIFNIDFVGAKTGKVLTKTEKRIQFVFNAVISRTYQVFYFTFRWTILLIVVLIVLSICKYLLSYLLN
tara:strand:+ start:299 stop:556 length:258 start_codon:yes stop_codon:yes gene_type:complete